MALTISPMAKLQRGPCCSRGKIDLSVRAWRADAVASKRPLLFAGEDGAPGLCDGVGVGALQRGPCCSRGKISSTRRCRCGHACFKEAPAVRGGRCVERRDALDLPGSFKEAPAVRGGRYGVVTSFANRRSVLQRGPCCSRGKIWRPPEPSLAHRQLQRGPCCSRGKIQRNAARERLSELASKRPLLFAGEDGHQPHLHH